jgi:hypothetical protein
MASISVSKAWNGGYGVKIGVSKPARNPLPYKR